MPTGRPSSMHQVLETAPNGTPITVEDRILELLRIGTYLEHAAASAGVDKRSVYDWLTIGARARRARITAEERNQPVPKLTAHQRRCERFSRSVDEANARWVVEAGARLAQAARGGTRATTVTEQVDILPDGTQRVTGMTRRTETLPPNPAIDQWRLERKLPAQYGRRTAHEVSGPGGGPIPVNVQAEQIVTVITGVLQDLDVDLDDRARAAIAGRLRAMSAAARSDAIDASSTDTAERAPIDA